MTCLRKKEACLLQIAICSIFVQIIIFSQGCHKHDLRMCSESVPDDQLAKIKCDSLSLCIIKIDGKYCSINPFEEVISVKVDEGKHTIKMCWSESCGNGRLVATSSEIWFLAKPAKTYLAKYKKENRVVSFWLEDENNGRRIGGIVGSIDEPFPSPHKSKAKSNTESN